MSHEDQDYNNCIFFFCKHFICLWDIGYTHFLDYFSIFSNFTWNTSYLWKHREITCASIHLTYISSSYLFHLSCFQDYVMCGQQYVGFLLYIKLYRNFMLLFSTSLRLIYFQLGVLWNWGKEISQWMEEGSLAYLIHYIGLWSKHFV